MRELVIIVGVLTIWNVLALCIGGAGYVLVVIRRARRMGRVTPPTASAAIAELGLASVRRWRWVGRFAAAVVAGWILGEVW